MTPRLLFGDVTSGQRLPTLSVDVTATLVVLGAIASRDWRPMHHDHAFAVERQGLKDIFLNTPNQAAWFERYITDWTGPHGRLGRMTFRMKSSVFPGDTMTIDGTVTTAEVDATGISGWTARLCTNGTVAFCGSTAVAALVCSGVARVADAGWRLMALPFASRQRNWPDMGFMTQVGGV